MAKINCPHCGEMILIEKSGDKTEILAVYTKKEEQANAEEKPKPKRHWTEEIFGGGKSE